MYSATLDCGEFRIVAPGFPKTIAPYGCEHIVIEFCPPTENLYSCILTIVSDDPSQGTKYVIVEGDGTTSSGPEMSIAAMSHDFGNIAVGGYAIWTFDIVNIGGSPLAVTSIGSNHTDFSVTSPSVFPRTVAPYTAMSVTVTFDPLTAGSKMGVITIESNDPETGSAAIMVTGNGTSSESMVRLSFAIAYGQPGGQANVQIDLDNLNFNTEEIAAMELKLSFPSDVLTIANVQTTSRTEEMNFFQTSEPAPGQLNILLFDSNVSNGIASGTGSIIRITFDVSSEAVTGDTLDFHFTKAVLSDAGAEAIPTLTQDGLLIIGGVMAGDANLDGSVNVLDMVLIANSILGITEATPQQLQAGDCNQDGSLNVLDMVGIANVILGLGTCPPGGTVKPATSAPAVLGAATISVTSRVTFDLPVFIETEIPVAGLQFQLEYDANMLEPMQPELASRAAHMTMAWNVTGGQIGVVLYSEEAVAIAAGSEPILTIPFKAKTVAGGMESQIYFEEVVFAQDCITEIPVSTSMVSVNMDDLLPKEYALEQNYPNPFNPATSVQFAVGSGQSAPRVTLKVYNLLGQEVATLVDEVKEAGYCTVTWDASEMASGVYFYRLTAGDFTETRRMVLMK